MPELNVPGAVIHYDTVGSGPILLLFIGAAGTGAGFRGIVPALSKSYTVVTWDRRGFSQSYIRDAFDLSNKLAADVDDAEKLLTQVAQATSQDSKAYIYGNSSGAVVALKFLQKYPDRVIRLLAHEPPAYNLSRNGNFTDYCRRVSDSCHSLYRMQGMVAGRKRFVEKWIDENDVDSKALMAMVDDSADSRANMLWWFEFELQTYTAAQHDLDIITREKDKIVPLVGEDTKDDNGLLFHIIQEFKGLIGKEPQKVPGGHIGYITHPDTFSAKVLEILKS